MAKSIFKHWLICLPDDIILISSSSCVGFPLSKVFSPISLNLHDENLRILMAKVQPRLCRFFFFLRGGEIMLSLSGLQMRFQNTLTLSWYISNQSISISSFEGDSPSLKLQGEGPGPAPLSARSLKVISSFIPLEYKV